jgi:hypothetical protein
LTVAPGTLVGRSASSGHPSDVAVLLAGSVGLAEVDVVDPLAVELGAALEQGAQDAGREVVGTDAG